MSHGSKTPQAAEERATATLQMTKCFMGCDACERKHDPFGQVLHQPRLPPRGWAGALPGAERRRLLIVAHHPGHPFHDGSKQSPPLEERPDFRFWRDTFGIERDAALAQDVTLEQAHKLLAHTTSQFDPAATLTDEERIANRKIAGYARACLWLLTGVDPEAKWLEHCWYTQVLKCTPRQDIDASVPEAMYRECHRHLKAEIELFRPDAAIALGKAPARSLQWLQPSVPVIEFLPTAYGCPQLHLDDHDRSFREFARATRCMEDPLTRRFVDVRRSIQESLFRNLRLKDRRSDPVPAASIPHVPPSRRDPPR